MTASAFRMLGRALSASSLCEPVTVTLRGGEPIHARAHLHRQETIEYRQGVGLYNTTPWAVMDAGAVKGLATGDLFSLDEDGEQWEVLNPILDGGGLVKFELVTPQSLA